VNSSGVLLDGFGRIRELVHGVVDGLTPDQLHARVGDDANTIAWLVWHLTRIQDDHVAHVADLDQQWSANGWATRCGLPFDVGATGYGHSSDEVAQVHVESGALLVDYYDDVHRQTLDYVAGLTDTDLDRVVDRRWNPPVTLGVRLVSVIGDNFEHAGQAAFVRGLLLGS
jgi:hypothetical protein